MSGSDDKIIVGEINGVFGVQGWVKVFSHTEPRENILSYSPWWLHCKGEWRQVTVEDGKLQGKSVVAKLQDVNDRDIARALMGCEIWIEKSQLRRLQGTLYWVDLIGCDVVNPQGEHLGKVSNLLETGAHDVLRVEDEQGEQYLIPFVDDHYILEVDVDNKRIVADWEKASEEQKPQ